MRRIILTITLLVLLILPVPAFAHDRTWDDGPPKGVAGYDGVACSYTATYQGHTYNAVEYIGADAGMMATDPKRERAWQESECHKYANEGVVRFFLWHENMVVTADQISITIRIRSL